MVNPVKTFDQENDPAKEKNHPKYAEAEKKLFQKISLQLIFVDTVAAIN